MEALTFPSYLIRKALASMKGKTTVAHLTMKENSDKGGGQDLSKKVPTIKWLGKRVI